jgi:hypothetical protein
MATGSGATMPSETLTTSRLLASVGDAIGNNTRDAKYPWDAYHPLTSAAKSSAACGVNLRDIFVSMTAAVTTEAGSVAAP